MMQQNGLSITVHENSFLYRANRWDRSLHQRPLVIYFGLLLFGIVCALFFVRPHISFSQEILENPEIYFMSARLGWLDMDIAERLEQGVYTMLPYITDHNPALNLYLSAVGAKFGLEAWELFWYMQLVFYGVLVVAFPACVYKATDTVEAALLSPVIQVFLLRYLIRARMDTHYIAAWLPVIAAPILFALATQDWKRTSYFWFGLLCLAMGVSNILRSQTAIGCAVALALIIIYQLWPKFGGGGRIRTRIKPLLRLLVLLACIPLSYNLFTNYVPDVYQIATGQPKRIASGGPWHTLYIGLGWEENPFSIVYNDAFGYQKCPEAFASETASLYRPCPPEYFEAIKKVYINTIKSDWKWCVGSYLRKTLASIKVAVKESSVITAIGLSQELVRSLYSQGYIRPWLYIAFFWALFFIARLCLYIIIAGVVFIFLAGRGRKWLRSLAAYLAIFICLFGGALLPGIVAIPTGGEWYLCGAATTIDVFLCLAPLLLYASCKEAYLGVASFEADGGASPD